MIHCDLCPAIAIIVLPGRDEERAELGFLLRRPEPTRRFCLPCAIAAGCLVYPSETPKRRKENQHA